MTHNEFEQRKRALEEQLQAAIQIVQESYRVQLRALELVRWSASSAPEGPPPMESLAVLRPAAARRLLLPEGAPEPLPAPRSAPGELFDLVVEALDKLPDTLTRDDVSRVLGFRPHRSTLYRTLDDLRLNGYLELETRGEGRAPNVYRKVRTAVEATQGSEST
jgi:hypothetical protein